jgi:hypothetical protein
VTATVQASVVDPEWQFRWMFDLVPREGDASRSGERGSLCASEEGCLYTTDEPLQFPLEPMAGDWRLMVYLQSSLEVVGERNVIFQPASIPFHDLGEVLPAGVDVRVPQVFVESQAQGDQWAGGRVWRYGAGEIALWWAPGPVEPLLLNNAVVMLEATHDPDAPPRVLDIEEMEWQGQTAFLFREEWPTGLAGAGAGPAEALVVQGPDHWLYVLRIRAIEGGSIPSLLRQIRDTFTF